MTRELPWAEPADRPPPEELAAVVGGHPLVSQLLARRGLIHPETALAYLDASRYTPAAPLELPGLGEAADLLAAAIQASGRICVWGDFDVDGQTATALLVAALQDLGAADLRFHIPVRARESHGVNLPVLKTLAEQGLDLLLTCDTGIAAHEAVAFAQAQGITVVITDHHDLPPDLPPAEAVVNPKRLPDTHPLATLPGVGVAFKLVEELYRRVGRSAQADGYLDLVALGLVADIALLTGDARYLLQRGLQALRDTRRPGLQAMFELAGLDPQGLTEEHIAFVLAPRLNALGRLGDANPAVTFLNTQDLVEARVLATRLEGLNTERKLLTDQVFRGVLAQIKRDPSLLETPVMVLSNPAWNAGVIGIVASRLVDQLQRPTILLAAPPGELARGSARSVTGIDISAAIAEQSELLESYGGHPMAAGFSLYPERIPELRRGLARAVNAMLAARPLDRSLAIDAYLPLRELTLEVAADLERLAPFGAGNPAPILVSRNLSLERAAAVGKGGEHLQVEISDTDGDRFEAIWWGGAGWPQPQGTFDLAYRARTRSYRGEQRLQVEWQAWRPTEGAVIEVPLTEPVILVHDHRASGSPLEVLQELLAQAEAPGELQVWVEGHQEGVPHAADRTRLAGAPALAIWTSPPGPRELAEALEAVEPREVHLFGLEAGTDSPQAFLTRLTGLLKYALRDRQGRANLRDLAGATGQREATVRLGVSWLAARGQFTLQSDTKGVLQVRGGTGASGSGLAEIAADLEMLLKETTAYRSHFRHAPSAALIPQLNARQEA